MKTLLSCGVVVFALVAGCGKPEETKPAGTNQSTVGQNPLMAPVDYLGTLAKGQQQAVKTVDTVSIDQAIQMFNVQEGRFPKDLNELVEKQFMPKLPAAPAGTTIEYDAKTGSVKIVKKAP